MKLINALLDLLYPPKCPFCEKILRDGESGICGKCQSELPFTQGEERKSKGEFFDLCISPLYYRGNVRESLVRYKFGGHTAYADTYGRLVAECVSNEPELKYDILSYVPISKKRYKRRGFDQTKLIAEAVGRELGRETCAVLKKVKNIPAQSSLTEPSARRANVMDVYEVTENAALEGKRILLIDDIVTTGATLSEATRTLLMAGAESVVCATVAKAQ